MANKALSIDTHSIHMRSLSVKYAGPKPRTLASFSEDPLTLVALILIQHGFLNKKSDVCMSASDQPNVPMRCNKPPVPHVRTP